MTKEKIDELRAILADNPPDEVLMVIAKWMRWSLPELLDAAEAATSDAWQPIETAPRGSGETGPQDTGHPDYVEPPKLLLWSKEGAVVGYYDWYYHEGYGRGWRPGVSAWRSTCGDPIHDPIHWRLLPAGPKGES